MNYEYQEFLLELDKLIKEHEMASKMKNVLWDPNDQSKDYSITSDNESKKIVEKPIKSIDDWRAWARVRKGNCPCNIPIADCKYH